MYENTRLTQSGPHDKKREVGGGGGGGLGVWVLEFYHVVCCIRLFVFWREGRATETKQAQNQKDRG